MDISSKTAVVTGGASGLGEATVKRLIEAGANVAVFDLNEDSRIPGVAGQSGNRVLYQRVDVADEEAVSVPPLITTMAEVQGNSYML